MITNERQYRVTSAQADRFRKALQHLDANSAPPPDVHPRLLHAERDALQSQLRDLQHELQEYEALQTGDISRISIESFDDLGVGLIKARIAAGLSHKALAARLGLKEQQIQRYEADRYLSTSYRRLQEIVRALGVSIREEILFPDSSIMQMPPLLEKLRRAGLDTKFFFSQLLPSSLAAQIQDNVPGVDPISSVAKAAEILNRIFGWDLHQLFGTDDLPLPRYAAAEARFKMPPRRSPTATGLYAPYANYLATVVADGCRDLPNSTTPTDAREMQHAIQTRYHQITLLTALHFAWDLGIPVLPLRDPGVFHGACWRYDGRNVIVLKQTTSSEARWLFDLLHELYHAAQNPTSPARELIETPETSTERRNSHEEIAASEFAGNVILESRAHTLAEMCVEAAKGSVDRLKRVVPLVASAENVPVDALANYLAFRLSRQGINWWGTATNLQKDNCAPWDTARAVFFERFPFKVRAELDRQLLHRALQ